MARQTRQAAQGSRPYRVHFRGQVELVEYAEETVPASSSIEPAGTIPASSVNAQGVAFCFLGATLADTHAYPPDSMGAVGPSQYIVAVNGRIRSFIKTNGVADGVLNADTDVFFTSVMTPTAVNFTSDPRIRYDRLSHRWFVIMIDVPNGTGASANRIMIAVSDGPIITGSSSWTLFQFQHDTVSPAGDSGKFADYPTLGVDANALYIGVNIFSTRGKGSFDNTTAFVVRKSSLLSGGPLVVTAFRGLVGNGMNVGPYTPQGVDNYDPDATEGYLVGAGAAGNFLYFDRLIIRRISNPGGTPAISGNIAVTLPVNTGGTINIPHLGNTGGTAGYLDGLDFRLLAAHYRNGRLWTSGNVAVDNTGSPSGTDTRMGARWYEIQGIPTGQTPSVVQSGTVFQPSAGNTTDQRNYWMGTIMVSGQGHAAMGFSVAGANERANAGAVGRLAGDTSGTMRTPILYTASSSAYNPRDINNNPINRWGDYSYTCLDPDDDMTMWTIQEFCNAPNSYAVQVAKLLAPLPASPISCTPATLTNGVSSINVTLVGSSDGDAGFFDPGAGFSNRITAAVSGSGVTVNSVIYNNPTNLMLNLSVAGGATTGARTVKVTNPDGQSAISSAGILNISSAPITNQPPVFTAISNQTVVEETLLTFAADVSDPDAGQQLTFSFAATPPAGATVNPTNGVFTWTPSEAQGPGTNLIIMRVTDDGAPALSATQTFTVFVLESNQPPVLASISDRTVHAGSLIMFTNGATDADLPPNQVHFSLQTGSPLNATIDATNGIFTWLTDAADANTTNTITVMATDDGVPNLSDAKSFRVAVAPPPLIELIAVSNNLVLISWTAIEGQVYQLQKKASIGDTNWTAVGGSIISSEATASTSDAVGPEDSFYRVEVAP